MTGCGAEEVDAEGLWADAVYLSDEEFGEGGKTVTVEVVVEEKRVVFTVHTDADTVGEALLEHELIDGDESTYGLYIKVVNGITADYDVNASYWAFYVDGEYAMSGIDATEIDEAASYQLVYTKE
ncbi:MAG: DUF4430 domain-containing protein [Ruminococcaceae bacterium]|nr:DUF4430 domain-containing protein [Oscillospiraceae bacterium]